MKINKPVDAVLFDLDGTLTDTERFYQTAWPKALAHFGYEMEKDMPLKLRSLGRPFAIQQLKTGSEKTLIIRKSGNTEKK